MPTLTCQNPECEKEFEGRVQKNYVSKFCSNQCSADDRKNRPEMYDTKKLGFQKGHKSWNAGTKGSSVGSTIIRKRTLDSGNVKRLRFINVGVDRSGFTKYVRYDRYVWEQANGPLPQGHAIYHKDGRTLNDELENLECIPIGEALSRYAATGEKVYDLQNKKHVRKIIKACMANDRRVQKILFDMCYDKGMSVAMRYAKDNDSAQDILTDAFIKVFNKIDTFNIVGSLEGWIMKIIVNTALDSIKKNKKIYVMDSDDMSSFDGMTSEDEDFEFEGMSEIKELPANEILEEIQRLSPGYKVVFNLFVFEGLTHKEISEELGISEGTSKSNLSKARQALKERVKVLVDKKNIKERGIKEAYRLHDLERV
jgi:RNA polymerase sigma-70 factor (ECF subfamily)